MLLLVAAATDIAGLAANASCGFEHWCPALAYKPPAAEPLFTLGRIASLVSGVATGLGLLLHVLQSRRKQRHQVRPAPGKLSPKVR